MLKHNQSINLYGKVVTVEYNGSHFDRNRVREHYHLLYDEAEVYHIEDSIKKEIVRAFPASSWTEAFQQAIMILDIEKTKTWVRGPLISLRYELNCLWIKIHETDKKYLPVSEKAEIDNLIIAIDEILKFNGA